LASSAQALAVVSWAQVRQNASKQGMVQRFDGWVTEKCPDAGYFWEQSWAMEWLLGFVIVLHTLQ
jgi:hypothetical protein